MIIVEYVVKLGKQVKCIRFTMVARDLSNLRCKKFRDL